MLQLQHAADPQRMTCESWLGWRYSNHTKLDQRLRDTQFLGISHGFQVFIPQYRMLEALRDPRWMIYVPYRSHWNRDLLYNNWRHI